MRRLGSYAHLAPLLLRLGIGLTFFFSGWQKVFINGTAGVAQFFGSLGIPLPGLMAPFVSYLELIGGLALVLGVFTRAFSLLLAGNMLVALLLVGIPGFLADSIPAGWSELRVELLLLLGSLALALLGPGLLSVDAAFLGERPERLAGEPAPTATRARSTGV